MFKTFRLAPLCIATALLTVLLPFAAQAQSADTAALEVYVHDPSGAFVPGAKLHLVQKQQNVTRDAVTDKGGHYRFTAIPVGDYTVTVDKGGFARTVDSGITLAVSQISTINISLKISEGSEQVTITSEVPIIDTDRTTIGQTISTEEIENLPTDSRNFLDFALTVPGITENESGGQGSGFSANGGRQRSNSVLVDGVENNSYLNGTIRQTISLDAVSQFQVMTNQFLPEYGQAAGAIINLITKSGTEHKHGDIYYYVRNPALNARSSCTGNNCAATDFYRNNFGATFGGPLYKDKTFFFASGEYLGQTSIDSNAISSSVIPIVNAALAAGFVKGTSVTHVSNGGVYYSFPQTLASFRVDHTFNERNTLLYRFIYAHYNKANPTIDSGDGIYSDYSNFGKDRLQAYSMMAEWTHVFTQSLLNEMHVQFAPQNLVQLPNSSGPSITISSQIEFGQNTSFPTYLNETHYEWLDGLSWTKNNHNVKLGADIQYVRAYTSYPINFTGHFAFSTVGSLSPTGVYPYYPNPTHNDDCTSANSSIFSCGFPYEYIQSFGKPDIQLNDKLFSVYIQDQWKMTPRLSINYGLRYDLDLQPQGYNGNMNDPIQAPLPKGIPRDYNNFAPRIGFAWALDKNANTVLRGGYGAFFDKIFLILGRDVMLTRVTLEELDPATATFDDMRTQWANGPYPVSYNYPTATAAPSLPPSIDTITKSLPIPLTQEATLFLDRALTRHWEAEVGGLFVAGQHLLRSDNTNLTPPVILTPANRNLLGLATSTSTNSQDFGRPYFGGARLNPTYNNITTYGSYGHSTYTALRASLVHRYSGGLTLRAGYVWSKSLDDGSDFTVEPSNPYDPQQDKGLSTQDQRNAFIASAYYRFPYRMHRHNNSLLRWVFGSWTGSAIYITGSGRPENITTGTDSNDDGASTDRPFINGTNGYCSFDAVACPNAGAIPIMATRNSFRGARRLSNSARLQKEINMPGGDRLNISVEAFNALNHSYVTDFNTFWGNSVAPSANFGKPDAWASPRSIQLGMKYTF